MAGTACYKSLTHCWIISEYIPLISPAGLLGIKNGHKINSQSIETVGCVVMHSYLLSNL